jgi:hypothetical protein
VRSWMRSRSSICWNDPGLIAAVGRHFSRATETSVPAEQIALLLAQTVQALAPPVYGLDLLGKASAARHEVGSFRPAEPRRSDLRRVEIERDEDLAPGVGRKTTPSGVDCWTVSQDTPGIRKRCAD